MRRRSKIPEIYVTLLLILMYLPILVVVVYSFNDTKLFSWEGFTFSWYQKLLHNRNIITAFFNSLELAALSSLSASVLGTVGAVGIAGRHFRGRGALENLSLIPIMVPEIILGMAYLAFFSFLRLPFGMLTLVLAHTTFCVPYIFINVKARLAGLDPAIGEAARDLGASAPRAFFDITLPLIGALHPVGRAARLCHEHGRRGHQLFCHRRADEHPSPPDLFHAQDGRHP